MADPAAPPSGFADQAKTSDTDLEKGVLELSSDMETPTIAPDEKDEKPAGDPNIVSWDGPDDPANPKNWTMRKKWGNIAVLSILTFITYGNPLSLLPYLQILDRESELGND